MSPRDVWADTILEPQSGTGLPEAVSCGRIKREREFYNRAAEPANLDKAALRVPAGLEKDLEPEMARLAGTLTGKTLCDYGCGWGVLSSFFAQRGARVYSFDVSDAHVALTRQAACINRVEGRVFAQVMAAERLAYPDNFFDYVIGNAVLHHVDLTLAAPEVYRVLKPGGRAIFAEPLGENRLLEWARNCPLRSAAHGHSPDERSFRYADIRLLARNFDKVEVRETRLLRMAVRALQEFGIGRAGGAADGWIWQASTRLARADDWLLRRYAWLRPLCQYVVVTAHRDGQPTEAAR